MPREFLDVVGHRRGERHVALVVLDGSRRVARVLQRHPEVHVRLEPGTIMADNP